MKATNLDIDLLRSFAAVADTGSFTAAGGLVARTQSAVSVQVKRLEELLGRRVFERTSRSLSLTPAGETLLGYARRMLELNDESVRSLSQPPVTGHVRLGITEYFVPDELPALLARFAAAYPGVRLEVRMGLTRDLREELARKEHDAVLVRLLPRERDRALWSEPQVWVAPPSLELDREGPLPLALLREGCVLREHALSALKRARRPHKVAFTGSSMVSVQAAVRAGIGVSIVPRSSVGPGMRIVPHSRTFTDPGPLRFGLMKGPGASSDIVAALDRVARECLAVLAAGRR